MTKRIGMLLGTAGLLMVGGVLAQERSAPTSTQPIAPPKPPAPAQHEHNMAAMSDTPGQPYEIKDEIAIFCPTMKTGQLCSSGTANILKLKGDQAQQWVAIARKYNKA